MYYLEEQQASTVRLQPLKLAQKYWKEGGGEKLRRWMEELKGSGLSSVIVTHETGPVLKKKKKISNQKKNLVKWQLEI